MTRPRKQVDLPATFRGSRILTLDQLVTRLSLSRATVLRRLGEHGYFSSYSHAGRFLSIQEVADFDSRGLWAWKAARFSAHGTLKQTARHFIQSAERGMTHKELSELLGLRVHNTLLDLVEQDMAHRERLGSTFVYLSPKRNVRRQQVRRRLAFIEERRKVRPSSRQIIATLLELIKDPHATRDKITSSCQRAGVSISREVVDAVFEAHELDKKRAL